MAEKKPNHLIGETSPYLLQHAYNPVEWYPWSAAAFERAKNEDKPVLVSIGYAACHWCHVMEHESFENETTATFMNTWFINIKVDREERPDIDHIYMNACQVMTGAGGWPLNIFLTPALLPFSGGTYFPPKPGFGKPSWMEVLMFIKNTFSTERDKVEEQATMLTDHMLKMDNAFVGELIEIPEGEKLFTHGEIGSSIEILKENFDTTEGGFGRAPKFPSTMVLLYLLRKNFFAPDKAIRDQVQLSLRKMMLGGIFDHVGGGFSRYTIDQKWMVPHFEKMLYDNALLVNLYAEAYMAEKNNDHRDVIIKTLDFLMLEMLQHEGGFYSSYDADSEGVEGKFYTYSFNEIENLFPGEMEFITTLYNLKKEGNWEHTNILFRTKTNAEIAGAFNLSLEAVNDKITAINSDLYAYRKKRIPPALDDKILLGWNALACSAFVMGYRATGIEKYKSMAIRNIDFLIHAFSNKETPGELLHTYKNNIAKYPAFIEDYASMIQALMDIYELTSDEKYMEAALNYIDFTVAHFIGDDDMFYFTKRSQADVPIRNKDFYDNATPSGNSMMVNNLLRMAVLSGKNELRQQVEIMLSKLKKTMLQYPPSFGNWLCSALKVVYPPAEIAITGNHASEFKNEILRHYYPHTIIQIDEQGDLQYPLIQNRFNDEGTFIYLCRNNTCHLPVSNVQDFLNELKEF